MFLSWGWYNSGPSGWQIVNIALNIKKKDISMQSSVFTQITFLQGTTKLIFLTNKSVSFSFVNLQLLHLSCHFKFKCKQVYSVRILTFVYVLFQGLQHRLLMCMHHNQEERITNKEREDKTLDEHWEKIQDSQILILEVIFVICSRRWESFLHIHRPLPLVDANKKLPICGLSLRTCETEI